MLRRTVAACLLAALLGACGSEELAPGQERLPRAPQLSGGPPSRLDYWSDSLGDYVGPEFLETPEEERFARFGRQLLEYRLREDLIAGRRWAMSQADIDAFCAEPDHDASARLLRQQLDDEPAQGGGVHDEPGATGEGGGQ